MPKIITREELRNKINLNQKDIHVIDVLGKESFNKYHLPNAVNVPISSDNFAQEITANFPDKSDEMIVYCQNSDCDASDKAAKELENMGYENVREYKEGKEGWKEAGLPIS